MKNYILLGCGYSRDRRIDPAALDGGEHKPTKPRNDFSDGCLVTVDDNLDCAPVVVMNLDFPDLMDRWSCAADLSALPDWLEPCTDLQTYGVTEMGACSQAMLREGWADEVHAYEVLEHLGMQGFVTSFFATFNEIWRILKPGGFLCATVPSVHSPWLWGDPGHRRVIQQESLVFLDRGSDFRKPPSSNYTRHMRCDFRRCFQFDDGVSFSFVLQAVKPAREFK